MERKYIFHVHGMHCKSCVFLTENELRNIPHVKSARSNLATHSVEVTGDFGDISELQIAEELTKVLEKHGYHIALEKEIKTENWSDFKIAIPLALGFVFLFVMLQKLGIVNLVNASEVTYSTAFVIGIIASLSTCMAVVGGFLLSMSATFAKEGDVLKPQLLFHGGRIISFFVLGGVIGVVGSLFTLTTFTTFIMSFVVGIVMLILGINLLDVFHWAKKIQFSTPQFLSKYVFGVSKLNHTLTPFLMGSVTFFLPCGFTQSMQMYTLTTGNFFTGSLTMLAFAVGTFPVLALISFSSFSIRNSAKSGIFFKTAGLVVILFALFNLINSLVVIDVIPPLFNF